MFSRKGTQLLPRNLSTLYINFHSLQLTCRYQTTQTNLRRAIGRGNIHHVQTAYESAIKQNSKIDRNMIRKLLLLTRHGKRYQDVEFIKTVIQDMKGSLKITPYHFEYHALIFAYGLQHLPEKAYNVLDQMRNDGVEPNLYTYNTLLGCYKRTNNLRQAELILKEMNRNKITPDTVTYNTVLHLLLRTGEFDRLFELYRTMTDDTEMAKPDIYTYSTVLDAAVKSQNQTIGNEICDHVLSLNKRDKIDLNILNNILRFKSDIDLNQVLELYYDLPDKFPHIQPDRVTFNILLDACLKGGNAAKAYMLFRDMKKADIKPDIITYGTLIDAESRIGNLKDAIQLFQDMCYESIEPNDRIMTSLVNIASSKSATAQDLDTLVSLVEKFQPTLQLDTKAYNSLMHGLALHGRSKQVQHLYDTVFRDITCQPDIATFTNLILSYINDDYLDDAMEIYYTLREHHKKCRDEKLSQVRIPIQLDTTFYSTLIASLSQNITPNQMTTDDEYESSPRLVTAVTMFNDMRPLRIQPTAHTYTAMLHACGQYRDRYLLDLVHQQIKVDMYLDPDIGIYNALMDAYNRTGDGDTVLDIWQTISMPASFSDIKPDQTSVSIVFDSCGHNGLVTRAQSIWIWLKRTKFKLNTNNYNSYIECLCRARDRAGWDHAYQLTKQEMSVPQKPLHGKPVMDQKTVNTLISFAKKKKFDSSEIESLEQWKSSIFALK
ncbi:hypothetical protein BDF21DRAFT_330139 [Thamnidium elegans]|uniref:Pentacotripeptide-repeat region of PRORP domain-containing protein n=1 Tax=Thamnidium elegans TaxID=101142 RepID=A0A8H7SXK3_9FUNG|nr:hypothetical protein INT48_001830 [Thamnidium elegans]KAI8096054.1 hypothetical protein BDF21DRAFT_330139 [Thamnidium elegans]